jgi:hypothetical protein
MKRGLGVAAKASSGTVSKTVVIGASPSAVTIKKPVMSFLPNTASMDRAYPDAAGAACAPVKHSLTMRSHSCDFCPNFRQG